MPMESAPEILGLGMSILDRAELVEEFPSAGGVTRVLASATHGGGPVPTALCAASRLGSRAAIVDRLGDDWQAEQIRDDYCRFGVSTEHLLDGSGRTSASAIVLVRRRDGERHILYREGDAPPLCGDELPGEAISGCRVLHLNGRHWPACLEAARIAREGGALVSLDGGAHRYEERLLELLPLVDLLVVAADFADRAVGPGAREGQLERLAGWGASLVGITDGTRGSWFREKGGVAFHQPAFRLSEIVDTTGCGDVFHGALLAARVRGLPWPECARLAAAAAALSATALGGRGFLPTWEEASAFATTGKTA
jgi:sulfofructose kinase